MCKFLKITNLTVKEHLFEKIYELIFVDHEIKINGQYYYYYYFFYTPGSKDPRG